MLKPDAKEGFLGLCFNLQAVGYPIPAELLIELEKEDYFGGRKDFKRVAGSISQKKGQAKKYIRATLDTKNEVEKKASENTVIVDASKVKVDISDISVENIKTSGTLTFRTNIKTEEWKIDKKYLMDHPAEFYDWINSINSGFQYIIPYWRFELYKAQAREWLSDKTSVLDFSNEGDQMNYIEKEIDRCNDNHMYALDKNWKYKNPVAPDGSGFTAYESEEAQRIICFLIDSGYSFLLGKARQIWSTTTIFGVNCFRGMLNRSYYGKMVTADEKKAVSSFNDKLKEPYYALSPFIKPSMPSNDTKLSITWYKNKKEQRAGMSQLTIETASPGAVNSGEPTCFQIDEIGMVDCLTAMINEWLPTRKQFNKVTGKLEYKNQFIGWGTSFVEKDGQMVDQSPEFEYQFRNCLKRFKDKKFKGTLIPIFLNCYARPGMTEDEYNEEKEMAYDKEGPLAEYERIRFHKSYPVTIDDMFLSNPKTIIPIKEIEAHLKRIEQNSVVEQYGFFTAKYSGDKIIGANWNPVDDPTDYRAACFMWRHPEEFWINRYLKGTDPINNRSGHSKFAASIWDALENTIACGMAWRPEDHRDAYEQSFLMGLYYDPQIQDLIESNAGQGYFDYLEAQGHINSIVANKSLPRELQTPSGNWAGINTKGNTRGKIIIELGNMLELYAPNINTHTLFLQLKTFIRKKSQTFERFEVNDDRFNFDDFIFAATFSFINAKINEFTPPRNIMEQNLIKKHGSRLILNKSTYEFEREYF